MKFLVIFALAIAASQAAPADDLQKAYAQSKITGNLKNGIETAQKDWKPVVDEYHNADNDFRTAIKAFPAKQLDETLLASKQKIQEYANGLKQLINDPHVAPEDKAHQAISRLSPVLDGILADFSSSSNNVENFLTPYQTKANAYATSARESLNKLSGDAQQWFATFTKEAKPELNNAYTNIQSNLKTQSANFVGQVQPAVQEAQNGINDFMVQHFE